MCTLTVDDQTTILNNAAFDGQNVVLDVEVVDQFGAPAEDVNVTLEVHNAANVTGRC